MEFEVERLKERIAAKTQSSANFIQDQSKTKFGNKTNNKKDPPKSGKSKSDGGPGPSEEKEKARHRKKPSNRGQGLEPMSQVW